MLSRYQTFFLLTGLVVVGALAFQWTGFNIVGLMLLVPTFFAWVLSAVYIVMEWGQ